ncbi:hypothetical protein HYT18_03510 [Candidatus Microgenomates bacterium]|nr:hypothetical protein [Candidatus Microgenomates bacterium]
MKKLLAILFASLLLFVTSSVVSAEKPENPGVSNLPQVSGDYPDPDHPGLRIRVFVHNPKDERGAKPQAEPASLVCSEDPDSSAFVGATPWKIPSGSWVYNLNPSSVPGTVGGSNLPTIAANSFSPWQDALSASATKPNLVRGSDTKVARAALDGIHTIAWNRIKLTAIGITYVWYWGDTGLLAEVDTIMNKSYRWNWSGGEFCAQDNAYDAQNILEHELGHWYGLEDEYEQPYTNNTMFGYGSLGETKKITPTTGDENGLRAIYP